MYPLSMAANINVHWEPLGNSELCLLILRAYLWLFVAGSNGEGAELGGRCDSATTTEVQPSTARCYEGEMNTWFYTTMLQDFL